MREKRHKGVEKGDKRRFWKVFIRGVGEGWAARAWAVFGASRSEEAVSEKVWRLCMRTQRQKDAAEYRFFVVFLYADGRG